MVVCFALEGHKYYLYSSNVVQCFELSFSVGRIYSSLQAVD